MFMTTNFFIMLAIVVYLAIMLVIGFVYSKRNNSTEDFYLGGRKMGPLVTATSAEASDMSSWLLMGLPGVAYLSGICDAAWTAIGLAVGTWLNWFFVSRKLRRYSNNIGAITVPDFFAKRFHDKNNVITALSALVIIIFFIPYTASGFAACGKLFNSLFGINYQVAMMLSALLIVGYTITGGFNAVCVTDLVQSIVMTGMDNAAALPGYLSLTSTFDVASGSEVKYNFLTIFSTAAWGLGYFGMPHILVRFMAIEDEKKLVLARRIASVWVVIAMTAGVLIGIVCLGMTKAGALETLTGSNSETIIVRIAGIISQHNALTALIAGIILAGILAATMSTADSQMLAAASGVSQNIVHDFLKIKISEKTNLLIARLTIVGIAIVSIFLARNPNSSVFKIVSFAWAGFGGAFGAVVLCSLFWKRCNLAGAIAGIISGGATVFIWKYLIRPLGGILDIYELLPAFIVSLIFIIVVSLLTKAPDEEIVREFEAAGKKA